MGNNGPPRRYGWQPGSYKAVDRGGHFPGGPNARSAFDGGSYDNGPQQQPRRSKGAAAAIAAAEAAFKAQQKQPLPRLKSAPPAPPRPPEFKLPREGPFKPGDYIFCTALDGIFSPCDGCGHRYFQVEAAPYEIPRLKCQRCGMKNRQLKKADIATAAVVGKSPR